MSKVLNSITPVATKGDKGLQLQFIKDYEDATEVHFCKGDISLKQYIHHNVVDIPDEVFNEMGDWLVYIYVIGVDYSKTTDTYVMKIDDRHPIPNGVAPEHQQSYEEKLEQIFLETKTIAEDVKARADNGEFNGEQGPKGEPGEKGQDGYTPVKGKDYFTPEEIKEIEQNAANNVDLSNYIKKENLLDEEILENTLGRTVTKGITSTSISALYTGFATRVANKGIFNNVSVRYLVSQNAVLSLQIWDEKANVIAESKNTVNVALETDATYAEGYATFEFDDIIPTTDNIYIALIADSRCLGQGIVTSNNTTDYTTSNNFTSDGNYSKVGIASNWVMTSSSNYQHSNTLDITVKHIATNYSLKELEEVDTRLSNLEMVNAVKYISMNYDNGYINMMCVDGRYVYIGGYGGTVTKVDIGIESAPEVVKSVTSVPKLGVSGIAVNGDNLYVALRDTTAGTAHAEDVPAGAFVVMNKSDLSIVSTTELDWKTSQIIIHGNLMMVNMQMIGWNLYDISNASEPLLLYSYRGELGTVEYQGGDCYEYDEHIYYVGGGFGFGVYIWDCTDTSAPSLVSKFSFSNHTELKGITHTYDVHCEYPYIYATLAGSKATCGTDLDIRGVLVLDVSDLDNIRYKVVNLLSEIITDEITNGDGSPVHLAVIDNYLLLNTAKSGITILNKNGFETSYVGQLKCGGDNGWIFNVRATEDGRIVAADMKSWAIKPSIYMYRIIE